jgi:NAD(P)-dependent dehydrogenase (short-subunit alcohol dehydrogenase family)
VTILLGKTVLVTGVGPGLGREVARLVLREGGNVVLAARSADRLRELADELADDLGADLSTAPRIAARPTDITVIDDCVALAAHAVERFGSIDGVVQVAAHEVMGGLGRTTDEDWHAVLTRNVIGTAHVVQATTDAMAESGGGIVLIGSQTFRVASTAGQQTAYAASKGALRPAMFHMAAELGRRKIRVNMVVPSWMWGPAVQQFVAGQAKRRGIDEADVIAEIAAAMPLGEIPADEDVAEAVVFLCSDRARMITGQTLYVNGGNFMT